MAMAMMRAAHIVSVLVVTVLSETLSTDVYPLSTLPPALHSPFQDPRICPQITEYCFSYDRTSIIGPDNWDLVCDTSPCFGGSNQSPVLIYPKLVKYFCDPYHRLGYPPSHVVTGLLENDGYYPNIAGYDMASAVLQGVPGYTDCRFMFSSMHIHVGGAGARHGTENRVNGKRYDGEMHLINEREGGKGSGSVAGQAVVAVFLSTRYGQHSPQLDDILNRLHGIQNYTGDHVCTESPCTRRMKSRMMNRMANQRACPHFASGFGNCGGLKVSFNPDQLLPPSRDFYYYYGSLTTPTLSESVLWQVMMEPLKITRKQLALIRAMETRFPGKYLADNGNLRPTQALGGRRILANCCHNKY
ncbi:putative carbonic anhydrase 1 [Haliotis rubra]|uniref:putative carbonic anhydrase 1 n=1 Tax=Haliotis rubra TaxID=36100 RepID=UPI001EE5A865|nr:putative carbonic anhydrase 1 [Haliotis rubra]XP_046555583.1 putative carbonic anhydrase 1 [Haliotis rubra]